MLFLTPYYVTVGHHIQVISLCCACELSICEIYRCCRGRPWRWRYRIWTVRCMVQDSASLIVVEKQVTIFRVHIARILRVKWITHARYSKKPHLKGMEFPIGVVSPVHTQSKYPPNLPPPHNKPWGEKPGPPVRLSAKREQLFTSETPNVRVKYPRVVISSL